MIMLLYHLLYAASFSAIFVSSQVAWNGLLPDQSGVIVYANDTYTVQSQSGDFLLSSLPSSFHINGSWWSVVVPNVSTSASCGSFINNWDCRGDDLYNFSATNPQSCCDNCSATSSCGAWTYTGTTADSARGDVDIPPWSYQCYIKADCTGGGSYGGHTSGIVPAPPANTLVRLGAEAISGAGMGSLGPYTGWRIRYSAGPATQVWLSFKLYASAVPAPIYVFESTFPQGAVGVNITTPVNTTTYAGNSRGGRKDDLSVNKLSEFSSSLMPSTQFPCFSGSPTPAAEALGYLTWAGRFMYPNAGGVGTGATAAFSAAAVGAEGGPIVLFGNASADSAHPYAEALVLSPFSNFKSTQFGPTVASGKGSLAGGISGYVTSLPINFTIATSLSFSSGGINDAMHMWGETLLGAYGTAGKRLADSSAEGLTYWTDNGAYYDFYAYEPDIDSRGSPQDILVALDETFSNGTYPGPPLPVQKYMLDAYWMWNTRANGNCKMNDSTWSTPFPLGLQWLSEVGLKGKGLIIYNGPQCGNTTYAAQWPLEMSVYWDQGWGAGVLSAIAASSSEAFYGELFASLQAEGMSSFTQDFLDFQGLLFPGFLEDPRGNEGWLGGQALAAQAAGVALQYCMALPSDLLASVQWPAVTNARASQDYGAGGGNWMIGTTSLLHSALQIRSSKDNFWTSQSETSPFLVAVVCALSTGPVGFADELLKTNPAVLWPTMMLNGTLLHPSRPATVIDAAVLFPSTLPLGDVRIAHSFVPCTAPPCQGGEGGLYYSILSARATATVNTVLTVTDLWPTPAPASKGSSLVYLLHQFNNSACAINGSDASACVAVLGNVSAGIPVPSPPFPDATPSTLWTASPLLTPSGGGSSYALLGELGKFVAVSPNRFLSICSASPGGGLLVSMMGAPLEDLTLAYIRTDNTAGIGGIVLTADVSLNSEGTATVTLQ